MKKHRQGRKKKEDNIVCLNITEIFANMHKNTNGTGTTNVYKGSLSCNDSLERKLVQKKRTKKEKRNGPLNTSFINNFNNLEIYCTSNKLKHKLSVSSHSIAENGTCNTPLDEDEVTKNDSTSLQGRAENLLKQGKARLILYTYMTHYLIYY